MNRFNFFLALIAAVALLLIACNKDDTPPSIENFQVNNTLITVSEGVHTLGETVAFEMDASDNGGLDRFLVIDEYGGFGVLNTQELGGSSTAVIKYDLSLSPDTYVAGDSMLLSFSVEDDFGNFDLKTYILKVIE